ncbi:hypothetical protein ACLOJK_025207 [Asimina triloba]
MFRSGVRLKKDNKNTPPQVVAVAVNSKKNSQNALKWAADNAIPKGQVFFLIHVRQKAVTVPTPSDFSLGRSYLFQKSARRSHLHFFDRLIRKPKNYYFHSNVSAADDWYDLTPSLCYCLL